MTLGFEDRAGDMHDQMEMRFHGRLLSPRIEPGTSSSEGRALTNGATVRLLLVQCGNNWMKKFL